MALVRLRTSELFLLLFLIIKTCAGTPPWIFTVQQNAKSCDINECVYNINVNAANVDEWSVTFEPASEQKCDSFFVSKIFENVDVKVDNDGRKVYFCVKHEGVWHHQGKGIYLDANDVTPSADTDM